MEPLVKVERGNRRSEIPVTAIILSWCAPACIAKTRKEVSKELRERGFNAYSMADSLEDIEKTSRTIQAIRRHRRNNPFCCCTGITNTMIMSIYERAGKWHYQGYQTLPLPISGLFFDGSFPDWLIGEYSAWPSTTLLPALLIKSRLDICRPV